MVRFLEIFKNLFKDKKSLQLLLLTKFAKHLPTEWYLKTRFELQAGYPLNLDNPQTFNEKLQWLKLHDHRHEYTQMVDKQDAKKYVAEKIGEEHIIPTLEIYDSFDEIVFEKLPCQFVLKCTHDSGGLAICKDKSSFNVIDAKRRIERSLKKNFYWEGREWPYKNVKPRIIAEKYMVDESGSELKDYKFFCFDGEPKFFKIDFNRYVDHHANYYSIDGELLPFDEVVCPRDEKANLKKPKNFEQMVELAAKLADGIPFVRVDLYNINGAVFFGELTFYPASGMGEYSPHEWDKRIGNMLKLPVS